jgi:hypothetical protein
MQQPKKGNPLNSYAKYSGIAIQMFVIIGLGAYLGVRLDAHNGDVNNLWTIICSLGATILAMVFVIRRLIANSKNDN